MNRIVFIKLPSINRYFEELRDNLILLDAGQPKGDVFRLDESRSKSVTGTYFRRRLTKYVNPIDLSSVEEEREIIDVFPFKIDCRLSWMELYNPARSIQSLMNRLTIFSSGKLSYEPMFFNVVSAADVLSNKGDFKVNVLKCKDLVMKDLPLRFSGKIVGVNLPATFSEYSGQDSTEIESLTGVFLDYLTGSQEQIELRRGGVICMSSNLTEIKKDFFRTIVKKCEIR